MYLGIRAYKIPKSIFAKVMFCFIKNNELILLILFTNIAERYNLIGNMEYKISTIAFDGKLLEREIPSFRGAVIEMSGNNPLYHNHTEDGKCIMHYPHVQYKIIEGKASLVGVADGADSIESLFQMSSCYRMLIGREYREFSVASKTSSFFVPSETVEQMKRYIVEGWLPFNKANYNENRDTSSLSGRIMQLDSVLKGNILSLYKDFHVFIHDQIEANVVKLQPKNATFKRVKMISYNAIIETNVALPEHCGIGKGVSHGFGTVKPLF